MPPTRRNILVFAGTSALPLISGCSASGLTSTSTHNKDESNITVRLTGPETDRSLFESTGVETVGKIQAQSGGYALSITLTDKAAIHVRETFRTVGVHESPDRFEISIVQNDGEIARFGVSHSLAQNISNQEWNGALRLRFKQREKAKTVQEELACAAKSAPVQCRGGNSGE